ncbi:acyl-CoA carboxylase epsilon subunit [Streptomyces sp. NBC_00388]|uniref:acyl-CoA carboxylase epsilon subunit n=1 Tax=Streptomyces sp. NBC_00388 TaxID=2975735 RepID=UPI002E1BF6DB
MSAAGEQPAPAVRLVRGNADDDELAAVVAVLHALAAGRQAPRERPPRRLRAAWTHTGHLAAGTWRAGAPDPRP